MDDRRKNDRAWDAQQNCHDPISPRDALPENDLVFFLIDLIPQMDLTAFHQYYAQELRGQPPFDVTMMVTLLGKRHESLNVLVHVTESLCALVGNRLRGFRGRRQRT